MLNKEPSVQSTGFSDIVRMPFPKLSLMEHLEEHVGDYLISIYRLGARQFHVSIGDPSYLLS